LIVATVISLFGFIAWRLGSSVLAVQYISDAEEMVEYYRAAQDKFKKGNGMYTGVARLLSAGVLFQVPDRSIPWSERMERKGFRFEFLVSADGQSYSGVALPLSWIARKGGKEFRVSSPEPPNKSLKPTNPAPGGR